LLLRIVRILIRDDPAAVGRLTCTCSAFTRIAGVEAEEMALARRAAARRWVQELRALYTPTWSAPEEVSPLLVRQLSKQLSFGAVQPERDEPSSLVLRPLPGQGEAEAQATMLRNVLRANTSITSLELDHPRWFARWLGERQRRTLPDALEIAAGLQANRTLTSCSLRGHGYGTDGWVAIFTALADNPSSRITRWCLNGENLGPKIAPPLIAYMRSSPSLTELDLLRNQIGTAAAAEIARVGTERRITLCGVRHNQTELDLNALLKSSDSTILGRHDARQRRYEALFVASDLRVCTNLVSVGIGSNTPSSSVVSLEREKLVEVLCSHDPTVKSKTTLDLSGRELGDLGVSMLVEMLHGAPHRVTTLKLRGNRIGEDGAAAIISCMLSSGSSAKSPPLATLFLQVNNIGCAGGRAFADALDTRRGRQLTKLDLRSNGLDDDTKQSLRHAKSKSDPKRAKPLELLL